MKKRGKYEEKREIWRKQENMKKPRKQEEIKKTGKYEENKWKEKEGIVKMRKRVK